MKAVMMMVIVVLAVVVGETTGTTLRGREDEGERLLVDDSAVRPSADFLGAVRVTYTTRVSSSSSSSSSSHENPWLIGHYRSLTSPKADIHDDVDDDDDDITELLDGRTGHALCPCPCFSGKHR